MIRNVRSKSPPRPWLLAMVAAACVCMGASWGYAQKPAQALQERLRGHVEVLAGEEFGGRGADSDGVVHARDYIAAQMEAVGLEPAGEDGWFEAIDAVVAVSPARDVALKVAGRVLAPGIEFSPLGCSGGDAFEGEVVFVGYGLSMPARGWDAYDGADVRGKVVVALTGAPSSLLARMGRAEASSISASSKAAVALAHGASAFVLINDPLGHGDGRTQRPDEVGALRIAWPLGELPAAMMRADVATAIFEEAGVDLVASQRRRDAATHPPRPRVFSLNMQGDFGVEHTYRTLHNVVGRLPAHGDASEASPVVLGAHYDGLGFGWAGSLGRAERAFHPGADDNASGVALMLEVARLHARRPDTTRHELVFVAFAGEEIGLYGSRRFAAARTPRGAVLTLDMVGRLNERRGVRAVGLAEAPAPLRHEAKRHAANFAFTMHPASVWESYSDHRAFYERGWSVLHFTTGRHGEYHTPQDTPERLNYEGLTVITRYIFEVTRGLATPHASSKK